MTKDLVGSVVQKRLDVEINTRSGPAGTFVEAYDIERSSMVGFLKLYHDEVFRNSFWTDVMVSEDCRGFGLVEVLYQYLFEHGMGYTLNASIQDNNKRSITLHEKLGFELAGDEFDQAVLTFRKKISGEIKEVDEWPMERATLCKKHLSFSRMVQDVRERREAEKVT